MRKILNKGGVYKLYWDSNLYFYIGSSSNITARFCKHGNQFAKGSNRNSNLQKIYNEYEMPKVMVLEQPENDKLFEREQHYLDLYYGTEYCCNIFPNAKGAGGAKFSKETVDKRLAKMPSFKGELNPFYNKTHSAKAKDKISKSKLGKKNPKVAQFRSKPVIDLQTGVFYDSALEISRLYKIPTTTLNRQLKANNTNWIYA